MSSSSYSIDFSSDEDIGRDAEVTSASPFDGLDDDDISIEITDMIERPIAECRPELPPRRTTDLGFLFRLLR